MGRAKKRLFNLLRYLSLTFIISFGLVTIVATGGSGDGGGSNESTQIEEPETEPEPDQISKEEEETKAILEKTVDIFWSWRGSNAGEDVEGWCGPARNLAYYTLIYLGVDPEDIYIHSSDRIFYTYYTHQFLVVDMPDGNTYLVDTTYNQFFQKTATVTHPGSLDWVPDEDDPLYFEYEMDPERYWEGGVALPIAQVIGTWMRADDARSDTADIIISDGYILLDDSAADNYAQGFTAGADDIHYTVSDLKKTRGSLTEKDELLDRFAEKAVEENFEPSADAQAELELILSE